MVTDMDRGIAEGTLEPRKRREESSGSLYVHPGSLLIDLILFPRIPCPDRQGPTSGQLQGVVHRDVESATGGVMVSDSGPGE